MEEQFRAIHLRLDAIDRVLEEQYKKNEEYDRRIEGMMAMMRSNQRGPDMSQPQHHQQPHVDDNRSAELATKSMEILLKELRELAKCAVMEEQLKLVNQKQDVVVCEMKTDVLEEAYSHDDSHYGNPDDGFNYDDSDVPPGAKFGKDEYGSNAEIDETEVVGLNEAIEPLASDMVQGEIINPN